MSYNTFLGNFPKIKYDIERKLYGNKETVTDVFFRVAFVKDTINQLGSYYTYYIKDGDTPETIAYDVYKDAGAHWMVIYANDIYDPQFDWPLDYTQFNRYVADKYTDRVPTSTIDYVVVTDGGLGYSNGFIHFEGGSGTGANAFIIVDALGQIQTATMVSNGVNYVVTDDNIVANVESLVNANLAYKQADLRVFMNGPTQDEIIAYTQRTPHHYEKVITRTNSLTRETDVNRIRIGYDQLTNGTMYVVNTNEIDPIVGETMHVNTEVIYANVNNRIVMVSDTNNVVDTKSIYRENVTSFSGTVVSYNNSNNYLVLSNTTGDFVTAVYLTGVDSGANLEIMSTNYGSYDYYKTLAVNAVSQTVVIDHYDLTETIERKMVSIYEHEQEVNDAKREIRIIDPKYYGKINAELKNLIYNYIDLTSNATIQMPPGPKRRRLM